MTELRMPSLSSSPFTLLRSGFQWLRRSGDELSAREALAVCHVKVTASHGHPGELPFADERNDLQVVLAAPCEGKVILKPDLSKGGFRDLVGSSEWDAGTVIGAIDSDRSTGELLPLLLAGRRGFECGEGRGGLLPGWHERARASWYGDAALAGKPFGNVLALGNCEQSALFRGDDMAFLTWFARAPGPAQIATISDERCVSSSAVLLQHLRRTPDEAAAIAEIVSERLRSQMEAMRTADFPAFSGADASASAMGRWPPSQDLLYAMYLLATAVATPPPLERSVTLTRQGIVQLPPPNVVTLSLSSEFAAHYRHRRTGWLVAFHASRFGQFIGPGIADWLRKDFERVPRTVLDVERDMGDFAKEVRQRTGALVLVQNAIATSLADRISNYGWLGDAFSESVAALHTEANLMLGGLTKAPNVRMLDADALAADLGTFHVPDRAHPSRELLDLLQRETQRILRRHEIPGF